MLKKLYDFYNKEFLSEKLLETLTWNHCYLEFSLFQFAQTRRIGTVNACHFINTVWISQLTS
jgi:hypothetical protein